jgi:hypothetical protein
MLLVQDLDVSFECQITFAEQATLLIAHMQLARDVIVCLLFRVPTNTVPRYPFSMVVEGDDMVGSAFPDVGVQLCGNRPGIFLCKQHFFLGFQRSGEAEATPTEATQDF